jgi:hypothetical protein
MWFPAQVFDWTATFWSNARFPRCAKNVTSTFGADAFFRLWQLHCGCEQASLFGRPGLSDWIVNQGLRRPPLQARAQASEGEEP